MNDGNPNQPPVECSSFLGAALGGAFDAVTGGFAGAGLVVAVAVFATGSGLAAGITVSAVPSSEIVEGCSVVAVSLGFGVSVAVPLVSLAPVAAAVESVVVGEVAAGVLPSVGDVAEFCAAFSVVGEVDGLTLVNNHVAIPMPAKMKTATATPAISIPGPPFFAGGAAAPSPSLISMSLSTNVGKRPRFLLLLGGAERSPDATERFAELAVGEATSVPPCMSGMTGVDGMLAAMP